MYLQPGGFDVSEDPLGEGYEDLAGRGKPHVASGSIKQLAPEFTLQALDLLAERGLCHVGEFSRTSEVARASDGEEVDELLELHVDSP
jgi:hypothetical protein